jgi:DNA-binding MarR family transcriptional regulator
MMVDKLTRSNLYRQLLLLSRHVETVLMTKLSDKGYQGLKMSYTEPMLQISLQCIRLNDLANKLGISKQFCNQSLKPIEALGLITRNDDPLDGRAKLISLTDKGRALNLDSFVFIEELTEQFRQAIGLQALQQSTELTNTLVKHLHIIDNSDMQLPLASLVSVLSRYCEKQLMELTKERGFADLQMSYTQVLGFLAMENQPVTVSFLAEQNNVSSQAISKTVNELEQRGYIIKTAANKDKRSKHIRLSDKGQALIKASIQSSQQLDQQLIAAIGKENFSQLCENLYQITHFFRQQNMTLSEQDIEQFNAYINAYFTQDNSSKQRLALAQTLSEQQLNQLDALLDSFIQQSLANTRH